ncbi:cytochrome P450 [Coprinopsis sp. MPI-PUGE-AT-0042]|nr:cytochrome P450 [Coprinopsis sp. MPI-PUGE-AT-0042]
MAWRILRSATTKNPLANVPGPKADSYFNGKSISMFVFDPFGWEYHHYLARTFPGIARVPGPFGSSMLHIHDPKALQQIVVRDQDVFEQADDFTRVANLVFGPGLLSTYGHHHRKQRKAFVPAFANKHMREMMPVFYEVCHKLSKSMQQLSAQGETELDMLSWMTRTALELIGRSGLGTSFDSLEPEEIPHPFSASLKNGMQAIADLAFSRFFVLPWAVHVGTPRFRRWVVDNLPWKKLQKAKDLVDTLHNISKELFESKKRALKEGGEELREGKDKDIISIVLKENLAADGEEKMSEDELLAQLSTLTAAAVDTTSGALSRTLQMLSENQDVQEKAREEVLEAKRENGGEDLTYDQLLQLPYLDAVCRETLRLHPSIPFVMRTAHQDALVSLAQPFTSLDGKETASVLIPKGTHLILSIMACNRDPLIWGSDADEWKPERWLAPLPESVSDAKIPGVYSNLMTFLGGGRSCIGFKFSQLEMKVVLSLLLESFQFRPSEKKIQWQLNGNITQPTVEADGDARPKMPVMVTPIHRV